MAVPPAQYDGMATDELQKLLSQKQVHARCLCPLLCSSSSEPPHAHLPQAALKAAKDAIPNPNYPCMPTRLPSWRVLLGPVLIYYGIATADKPMTFQDALLPIFTFGVAMLVGQSLVEWVERMEWRQNIAKGAQKARDEYQEKENKEKKEKAKAEYSGTGSTKKKKS